MDTHVILTVIGSDRPGLTEALAGAVLASGGNWLEGHLSRLGGKYVGSVLVALPAAGLDALRDRVAHVDAAGLKVDIVVAGDAASDPGAAGTPLELSLVGQDRLGIVRDVSAALSALGVNIETLETGIEGSAWSGSPLFRADIRLRLPPGVGHGDVQTALESVSGDMMVDFKADTAAR
jgi:glycine cleavage system regulatory protein